MRRHLIALVAGAACIQSAGTSAAPLLLVDINDRTVADSPNTAPGFSPYVISSTTASTGVVNGYTVNFDVFDDGNPNDGGGAGNQPGAFDDRDRDTPNTTPNFNQLYDDFIFVGASAGPAGGVDLSITGGVLRPNRQYTFSIYAYDGISEAGGGGSATPVRTANWFDGNNLDALVLTTVFATNVRPTADDTYKFTGVVKSDASGRILVKGRRVTAADVAVYINGFELNPIPEPATKALAAIGLMIAPAAARMRRRDAVRG